ncbi:chorion peroxidase-like [Pollicipes pollicipes]|uniref:chorion peroxidase-like n=1 Tax=Pollicipes pollicipes TaxID=41117 RepID=UPI001884BB1A|nr:chorion peroxidase-like [Pollicipes pollicipes]
MTRQLWRLAALLLGVTSAAAQLICVPLVLCPELMEDPNTNLLGRDNACFLRDRSDGGLCVGDTSAGILSLDYLPPAKPTVDPADAARVRREDEPLRKRLRRYEQLIIDQKLPPDEVSDLVCEAEKQALRVESVVLKLALKDANLALPNSPEELQLLFAEPQGRVARALGLVAQLSAIMLAGLQKLGALFKVPPVDPVESNAAFSLPPPSDEVLEFGSLLLPNCTPLPVPECGDATLRYRTHDGSCNNLLRPRAGSANSQYSRYFPSEYADGVSEPRAAGAAGRPLPSARFVSAAIGNSNTADGEDGFRTIALTLFGQFVDHDVTSTPEFALEGEEDETDESAVPGIGFNCCHRNGSFPSKSLHPMACNPIRVPEDDPYFSLHGVNCISQVRSLPAPSEDCLARPLNQQNQITHYLDGSNIYGSSEAESTKLRAGTGGLISTTNPGRLLPRDEKRCARRAADCFVSGDHRAGENVGLAFVHLVWTREHNRVATFLAARHPDWDDERLYQEARRIVVGEYQHVVYNEFLPAILGYGYVRDRGLKAGDRARVAAYSADTMPTITTEFSSAAFRFGHSMVHDVFRLQSRSGRMWRLPLEETFFNSTHLQLRGIVGDLARSLTSQLPGRVDTTFSPALTQHLFAPTGKPGLDLIALNIQRGREHGLASYVTALENCVEHDVAGWDDFQPYMTAEAVEQLQAVYDDFRDVDLFVGGVSERRLSGSAVGTTFQCIIGEQFFDLRYSDRFFYDIRDQPNSFTVRQLEQLQRASFARILCDNVDGLNEMQQLAFFQPDFFLNKKQNCSDLAIPTIDLKPF